METNLQRMLRESIDKERERMSDTEDTEKVRGRSKMFLNDSHHEFGTVAWHVNTDSYRSAGGTYISINADLRLSDCSESITLDFDTGDSVKRTEKRIEKLDNLINSLKEFKSVFLEAAELQKAMEDKRNN